MNSAQLPSPPLPLGQYHTWMLKGGVGTVSGQLPIQNGRVVSPGVIGEGLTEQDASIAIRLAADNALAQVKACLEHLDEPLVSLLHLAGYIRTMPDFGDHARLMDIASDRFVEVLGADAGSHTRSVVGVTSLPGQSCVELVLSFTTHL